MSVLVLGATGLLGTEVMAVLQERGIRALGAARSGADLQIDVTNQMGLFRLLCQTDATAVINCVANVNLAACEADQEMSYRVNAAPVAVLAAWSQQTEGRLIHVSTDQFFRGEPREKHDETALVHMINAYGASKFTAETMAREAPNSLVVRTNICGAKKGFGRWAIDSLTNRTPIGAFTDYFTSTMHVRACAEGLVDLMATGETGVINLASRDVSSKEEFMQALAAELGINPDWMVQSSARDMTPERALSCGLDVARAEAVLGRAMPTLSDTVRSLVHEDAQCVTTTNSASATVRSA